MGTHRERPPLLIRPRLSRYLAGFVLVTHLVAAAVILALPLGVYRLPLLLLVLGGLGYSLFARVLGRAPWSPVAALWASNGDWTLSFASGRELPARLSPSTYVGVRLVVLSFHYGRFRRCAMPLFPDALDPEQLRRLRQRLRVEGSDRPAVPEVG